MGGPLTDIRLPYVHAYRDVRGRMRYYVRRKGRPRVALPGQPGSKPFMDAYAAAVAEVAPAATPAPKGGPRSLGVLIASYKASPAFKNRSAGTQDTYRKVLKPIEARDGHRGVADMPDEAAQKIVAEIGEEAPGMANLTIAVMRQVFRHAIRLKWRHTNPFLSVERYKLGSHHTWTDEELGAFAKRWPIGTRERVAFDLLFYTAQRIGDVARMKRADITKGFLMLKQQKTGKEMAIEVVPALKRSLNAYGIRGQHLIGRIDGRQITSDALRELMIVAAKEAGLPRRCVPHGIRKAALRIAAERGASTKALAGLSGHATLKEVERYTAAADQRRLASIALAALPDLDG